MLLIDQAIVLKGLKEPPRRIAGVVAWLCAIPEEIGDETMTKDGGKLKDQLSCFNKTTRDEQKTAHCNKGVTTPVSHKARAKEGETGGHRGDLRGWMRRIERRVGRKRLKGGTACDTDELDGCEGKRFHKVIARLNKERHQGKGTSAGVLIDEINDSMKVLWNEIARQLSDELKDVIEPLFEGSQRCPLIKTFDNIIHQPIAFAQVEHQWMVHVVVFADGRGKEKVDARNSRKYKWSIAGDRIKTALCEILFFFLASKEQKVEINQIESIENLLQTLCCSLGGRGREGRTKTILFAFTISMFMFMFTAR